MWIEEGARGRGQNKEVGEGGGVGGEKGFK